jgi:hypothetical protein
MMALERIQEVKYKFLILKNYSEPIYLLILDFTGGCLFADTGLHGRLFIC